MLFVVVGKNAVCISTFYVGPMHSAMPNREAGKQWKLMAQIHSLYIFYYQIAIYKTKILRIAEVKGIQNNEVGKRGLCKPVSLKKDSGHWNPFIRKAFLPKNNDQKSL